VILTGPEIYKRLEKGEIVIDPFNEDQLNPNSYNLRLHSELMKYDLQRPFKLDPKVEHPTYKFSIPEEGQCLRKGELYLGRTVEFTSTFDCAPSIEGRSSLARLGLNVHISAGFGDVGFCGHWTLEIVPTYDTIIYPNMEICQIFYHEIIGEVVNYDGKYQNNTDVQPSYLFREFSE